MGSVSLIQLALLPLIIGYLIQFLVEPGGELTFNELPDEMQHWYNTGEMVKVGKYSMFTKRLPYTGPVTEPTENDTKVPPTIVIIHGFPSSSFDYHKTDLSELQKFGPVLMYDHLGFGFSDKPKESFTYSIFELADYSLMLFKQLGVSDMICIGHDMGDTVLAELVKRRNRDLLPPNINLHGVAFTNGGINFKYAKLRLAQHALRNPYFGEGMNRLLMILKPYFPFLERKSYVEIWGSNDSEESRNKDIDRLNDMNAYKGGIHILHKSIFYLNDRDNFEYSWHESFRVLDIPSMVIWGDDDAVAPAIIGSSIAQMIKGADYEHKQGVGHFLMLEDPKFWTKSVIQFLTKTTKHIEV